MSFVPSLFSAFGNRRRPGTTREFLLLRSPLIFLAVAMATLPVFLVHDLPPAQAQGLSSDATLSGLALLDRQGTVYPLRPLFDAQTQEYEVTVPLLATGQVGLRPTANHRGASITVAGKTVASGATSDSLFLQINTPKRVVVAVTAEDDQTRREYAVTATWDPRAELRALSVSDARLHPFVFSGTNTDYRTWVAHSVTQVKVTPTNRYDKGTITVNGHTVASGSASPAIALTQGDNTITVTITAPDGYTARTYTVAITRASAAASADATLSGLAVHTATSSQPDAGNEVPYEGTAYQLVPALAAGVYDYRVQVPDEVERKARESEESGYVYVTAVSTTTAPGAKSIVVEGEKSRDEARNPKKDVVTGESSGPWLAFTGYSPITIKVTSLDGTNTQTYRVTVQHGSVVDDPRGVTLTPGDGQITLSWGENTGDNAPNLYWARWRKAGTTTWLNSATLAGWKTAYGDGAPEATAADGQRVTGSSHTITGLDNGTEYEVQLRGTRGGSTKYQVTNWLKSGWVTVRGYAGQPPAGTLTITPSAPSREYGGTDDLSYTVSGLDAADTATDVVTGSLSRAAGNDAGSYAFDMSGLSIAAAYTNKYTLSSAPSVANYTITSRAITSVSGVTVNSRPADGSTSATFDTSGAQGTGVLTAELSDFQSGGLVVSGSFPAATAGTHSLSVTYSLSNQGSFKSGNYTLSSTTDTLQGEITQADCGCASRLILLADGVPAEGGDPVTVVAGLPSPAGAGGVTVTLTASGTATVGDDYTISTTTVSIAEGATAGMSTITIIDDAVDDDDETIILSAAASSLNAASLTLTIADNDDGPVIDPNCTTPAGGDYDADDDGLIEVSCLGQLNAIRWDLDSDGVTNQEFGLRVNPQTGHGSREKGSSFAADYAAAFPGAATGMGCPQSGCKGYELTTDLDFDTNGNGRADAGDDYWNGGRGWWSIGAYSALGSRAHFSGVFEGNGYTIRNLYINGQPSFSTYGFFTSIDGVIRNLNMESVHVSGYHRIGSLVAQNRGTITDIYVSGTMTGSAAVGGLVGENLGIVRGSYAAVSVAGTQPNGPKPPATNIAEPGRDVGGLVGINNGTITASYASGSVSGKANNTGGLVGLHGGGSITASYARGAVSGSGQNIGGLVGKHDAGVVTNAYWDTQTSGTSTSAAGVGKTTAELQSPTSYAGIYANWNVDLDGDSSADDPWDFGSSCQYPVLKYGGLNPDDQRAPCTPIQMPTDTGKELLMPPCEPDSARKPAPRPGVIAFIMCEDHLTVESVSTDSDITFYPEFSPDRHHYVVHIADDVTELKVTGDFSAGFPAFHNYPDNPPPGIPGWVDMMTKIPGFAWAFATGKTVVNHPSYGNPEDTGTANNIYSERDASNSRHRRVNLSPGVTTIQIGGAHWFKRWGPSESETISGGRWYVNSAKIARKTYTLQLVWQSPSTALEAPPEPPAPRIVDYDTDDDGLIEISNLAQLDAMRWDVNGDGYSDHGGPLHEGFPNPLAQMGCPQSGCIGYELTVDLDFDTNGNGRADSGDAYWNSGHGWLPIGIDTRDYNAVFEGNGYIVRNLYINSTLENQSVATEYHSDSSSYRQGFRTRVSAASVGLFEGLAAGGVIRNIGLESVDVSRNVGCLLIMTSIAAENCWGSIYVGGLVGHSRGEISGSHVSGVVSRVSTHSAGVRIQKADAVVGGLVGYAHPSSVISGSYSTASVSGKVNQSANVGSRVGGLVGHNRGTVTTSYATGDVSSDGAHQAIHNIGGLIGRNGGPITASYATGGVTGEGTANVGGLVGHLGGGAVTASYWDTETSGQTSSAAGVGKTTAELQSPAGYSVIYADWNLDLDGDSSADDPWDFGNACQYPVLKYGSLNPDDQRASCTPIVKSAPVVYWSMPDVSDLEVGDTRGVRLAGVFWDPDGDPLTITAVSSDETKSTVSMTPGPRLTVTGVAVGTATVTVTAEDSDANQVSNDFEVTVIPAHVVNIADCTTPASGDYDADNDGLIEVSCLVQLNAIRWDLDGDGSASDARRYAIVFPNAATGMGCPQTGCEGYELTADLDFDTNNNGEADAGDTFWNGGQGWIPMGDAATAT